MTAAREFHQESAPSWLARLRYTPMSDLLSGRVTGRLSLWYAVHSAQLPQPLPNLIMSVTIRSRLWRREKLDVARELITHFQDGLDAGASADELAHDFGDPTQAAVLIRRAKKRNRPLWWRASMRTLRGSAFVLLLLLVFYVALAIRYFAGSPTISHDYLADLNKPAAAVPPDQRAWPMYRTALLAMPELSEMVYRDGQAARFVVSPGDDDREQFDQYAAAHADELTLVREAANRQGLGYVMRNELDAEDRLLWPDWEAGESAAPMINVRLPHRELRMLIVLLEVDSQRAAIQNNSQRILQNIDAILGIARHSRENGTFIGDLVALAHVHALLDSVGKWLAENPEIFTDEQLQRLAHQLAACTDDDLQLRLDGERLFFHDIVQRIYTDDGQGDGRITHKGIQLLNSLVYRPDGLPYYESPPSTIAPAFAMLVMNRKDLLAEYNRLMNAIEQNAQQPLWRMQTVVGTLLPMWEQDLVNRWRYLPLVRLLPALERGLMQPHYVRASRDAMLTATALELYRRRNNGWPQSLAELIPSLLPEVPRDPFDGQPLRYKLEGGALLYSIGADKVDDGGVPAADPSPSAWRRSQPWSSGSNSGDWILWKSTRH